jgi:carotenoid 1,2-hydratase
VGSVFSPYYARAYEKHGDAVDPENHCAINVALYGAAGKRWAMTERSRKQLHRERGQFVAGPSQLSWQGDHLCIDLNELCAPIPFRIRGRIRVYPSALCTFVTALDDAKRHRWGPIAPCARVEVKLDAPQQTWQGSGYFDSNEGDEPVTGPFSVWDWSRSSLSDGSTAVIYDVRQTNGSQRVIAERFGRDGSVTSFEAPAVRQSMKPTLWRIQRNMRSDAQASIQVLDTLEDAPFYARSLLKTRLLGETVTSMHETLQAQRLLLLPVRMMLPWRMPRWN